MPIEDQPAPIKSDRTPIADLVIADMHDRKQLGIDRYGTALQAFNGRDSLVDAFQEVLDLTVYIRQTIEEQKEVKRFLMEIAIDPRVPECYRKQAKALQENLKIETKSE